MVLKQIDEVVQPMKIVNPVKRVQPQSREAILKAIEAGECNSDQKIKELIMDQKDIEVQLVEKTEEIKTLITKLEKAAMTLQSEIAGLGGTRKYIENKLVGRFQELEFANQSNIK